MAWRSSIFFLATFTAFAQQSRIAALANSKDSLHQLSDSIETLSEQVSPAVVQIFSTSYTLGEEDSDNSDTTTMGLVTKQRSTGSGVILSADGYIITNNHVVRDARHVRVQLASRLTTPPPAPLDRIPDFMPTANCSKPKSWA